MRQAVATLICGMATLLSPAASAQGTDEMRPFHSRFRTYLETYAKATLPRSSEYSVAIIGLVNKPKTVIDAQPGLTLRAAIDQAGGFAPYADQLRIGIWRNEEGRFLMVSVHAIATGRSPDLVLLRGDIVIVIERQMDGI